MEEVRKESLAGNFNSWRNTEDPVATARRNRVDINMRPVQPDQPVPPPVPIDTNPQSTLDPQSIPLLPAGTTPPQGSRSPSVPSGHTSPLIPSPKSKELPGNFFFRKPPEQQDQPSNGFARGLATLMKIYDRKLKYHGGDDVLDMCTAFSRTIVPKQASERRITQAPSLQCWPVKQASFTTSICPAKAYASRK